MYSRPTYLLRLLQNIINWSNCIQFKWPFSYKESEYFIIIIFLFFFSGANRRLQRLFVAPTPTYVKTSAGTPSKHRRAAKLNAPEMSSSGRHGGGGESFEGEETEREIDCQWRKENHLREPWSAALVQFFAWPCNYLHLIMQTTHAAAAVAAKAGGTMQTWEIGWDMEGHDDMYKVGSHGFEYPFL